VAGSPLLGSRSTSTRSADPVGRTMVDPMLRACCNALLRAYIHAEKPLLDRAVAFLMAMSRCASLMHHTGIPGRLSACGAALSGGAVSASWPAPSNDILNCIRLHTTTYSIAAVEEEAMCTGLCVHAYEFAASFSDQLNFCVRRRGGGNVAPDIVSFNMMVSGFGRVGQVHEAVRLFATAQSMGLMPTVATYTALMRAALHAGLPEVALQAWEAMKSSSLRPQTAAVNVCLDALLQLVRCLHLMAQFPTYCSKVVTGHKCATNALSVW
jgi:pentatricopeptide repeat protein